MWREKFATLHCGDAVIWVNVPTDIPLSQHDVFDAVGADATCGVHALRTRKVPGRHETVDLSGASAAEVSEARDRLIDLAIVGRASHIWMRSTRSLGRDAGGAEAFLRLLDTGVRVILPHHTDGATSVIELERSPDKAWESHGSGDVAVTRARRSEAE